MPTYHSASGSAAEDLFIELFSETFGAEKAGYLYSQYHFYDIYQNSRYADFVLENGARRVAIEIDDETSHSKSLVASNKFYDDLLKQNSMVYLGWDVYRWAVRQMQIQPEAVKDELRVFLGSHPQFKEIEDYLPQQRGKALDGSNLELKKHQIEALQSLQTMRDNSETIALLYHATGTGKTVTAVMDAKSRGGRTLFLAHTQELVNQATEAFRKLWPSVTVGRYMESIKQPNAHVVCGSVQSVALHLDSFKDNDFDYLIVDEAHHAAADTYQKVLSYFKPSFTLGLTATPERTDDNKVILDMPYYVDQENGWAVNSSSFDRMTQFDLPQRKNSYFFHLGALDSSYVEISKRHKTNSRQIEALTKETEKYHTVIETLQAGFNAIQMSFDTDSLERAISTRQQEIKRILDELTKIRSDLLEAEDELVQLTHEKELLSKYIKKKALDAELSARESIECPRCGMVFEQALTQRLEKEYLRESLLEDYTAASTHQTSLEKRIKKLRGKFEAKQRSLADFEEGLASDRESYNAYVKSKATNQLLKEYWDQIGHNTSEIDRLRKDNTEINKQLAIYTQGKEHANTAYQGNLTRLLVGLDIPSDQVEENSEPGSNLVASGAYGPRCKIAQILAFVETQHTTAPNLVTFPIVIDSPNVLEQDNEHLDSIIRTLLTWNKTDNQIIVASIQGKDTASKIDDVNIITLSNPQNHLFNSDEYIAYEAEITEIFTQF